MSKKKEVVIRIIIYLVAGGVLIAWSSIRVFKIDVTSALPSWDEIRFEIKSSMTLPLRATSSPTVVVVSSTPTGVPVTLVIPTGADPEFVRALEEAIIQCGQDVYLVGVLKGRADGQDEYDFAGGTCGPEPGGEDRIPYDSNTNVLSKPIKGNMSLDTRKPITLSDWNITWRQALQIGGVEATGVLHLYNDGNDLGWDVVSGQAFYPTIVRVNATTGQLVSYQKVRITY